MKNWILSTLLILIIPSLALAAQDNILGVYFGFKSAEFSSDASPEPDFNSKPGFILGAISVSDFMGQLKFRTGGYYAQREAEVESGGVSADFELSYIDVPLTILLRFNDFFSGFAGAVASVKFNDDCKGDVAICNSDSFEDANSFMLGLQMGAQVEFHPNWGGELVYEYGLTEVSDDVNVSALSVGVLFFY